MQNSSDSISTELTGSLKRKRKTRLACARKIALSLRDLLTPHISENDIPPKKLEKRFNKVVHRLRERVELDLPVVLTIANKIQQLHELRNNCKKIALFIRASPTPE
ncbi:MAG TPA: hypothetical protein VFI73_10510 [Candidatus Nitrosopolaris sp.]|nr:hypothetical protein [Candidatus Nitrosopolaris sp.]